MVRELSSRQSLNLSVYLSVFFVSVKARRERFLHTLGVHAVSLGVTWSDLMNLGIQTSCLSIYVRRGEGLVGAKKTVLQKARKDKCKFISVVSLCVWEIIVDLNNPAEWRKASAAPIGLHPPDPRGRVQLVQPNLQSRRLAAWYPLSTTCQRRCCILCRRSGSLAQGSCSHPNGSSLPTDVSLGVFYLQKLQNQQSCSTS